MPNYCDYEMKIKGSKSAITRVVRCLEADYNYSEGKPEHKHFFRVFEANYNEDEMEDNGNGTFTLLVYGYCAWSVWSCMCSGNHTYYSDLKESHPDIFMGTDLYEQSEDCEIEVFSEEGGMGFSEHYLFKNGKCLIDNTEELQQAGYTKQGKLTTHINWDTYDGDYISLNPNRENLTEEYCWVL